MAFRYCDAQKPNPASLAQITDYRPYLNQPPRCHQVAISHGCRIPARTTLRHDCVVAGFAALSLGIRSGTVQAASSWQTSAPREAIWAGDTATLGLRNKFGVTGECVRFAVEVYDGFGDRVGRDSDWVCGDEWTYMDFWNTAAPGEYTVYFGVSGELIATDHFHAIFGTIG